MTGLRFAVLLTGDPLERWHVRCLDQLEDVAELATVIVAERSIPGRGGRKRLGTRWFEARLRATAGEMPEHLLGVEHRIAAADAALGQREWDFVISLGRSVSPEGLENATSLGIWFFEHEQQANALPFFREVYDGEDVTRAELVALRPGGERIVLEQGFFRTERRSYGASHDRVLDAAAAWPARVCRRVLAGDAEAATARGLDAASAPTSSVPGIAAVPVYLARTVSRRLRVAWQRLFRHPQWNIGVLAVSRQALLESPDLDDRIEWFALDDRTSFLADPFGVEREGTLHVLCERFRYRDSKGYICAFDATSAATPLRTERAIELPVHLSYPFLVEQSEGDSHEIYCIPESSGANEVALFRADAFPREWSKAAVLIDGFPGVDPTVFRHGGRWWLMCTSKGALEDVELWAWHAPSLFGPWVPHARNPIKSDVRGSRPAGRPFCHQGVLYRPAQDCSRTYGWRIALQRVTQLTPAEFAEEPVRVLEASPRSPFPHGRHTLTVVGDKVLIDGRRDVFVLAAFRAFLKIWAADWSRRALRHRGRLRRRTPH